MSDKIICLVGESGSGKSTIAELLEKDGYNYIQSYTTRKPRRKREKGHIFVRNVPTMATDDGEGDFNREIDKRDMIAYTFYNGNHYWATKEQYKNKGTSVYVIDPAGIKYLKERVTDAEIVIIYLKCDECKRLVRIINRNYNKVTHSGISVNEHRRIVTTIKHKAKERLFNDREAFKIVQCDYVVDANRPVKEVLKDIKDIIKKC